MNFFLRFNFEGALTSLPVGSFDTSHITTVGNNFFAYSFCNNQLSRDTILQVASKRNLDQTNLNNRYRVFDWTFSGNAVTGSVTEADIPQLAFNPNSVRNTFAGTNLTTTSANYQNWGLLQLTPPNAIVFYTPTSGTRTSGTVLATLTANKPLLPLT
ncbi:MAG: hypothetical protein LBO09_07040 [Candidatus Peribacteria bacterium]|jgi:surface protein|nr:hypothetical protein [Candidatus Peribacteria bacterium]